MSASVQPNTAQYSPDSLRQPTTSQYRQVQASTAKAIFIQPLQEAIFWPSLTPPANRSNYFGPKRPVQVSHL